MTFGIDTNLGTNSINESNASFIFRTMTDNRKRTREDDTCEFMPLSKRINNLHINNNLTSTSLSQSSDSSQSNGPVENGLSPQCLLEAERPSYDPGVSSQDSSYYFNNKLLFELHLERLQRSGQEYQY